MKENIITGIVLKANVVNKNGRMYKEDVLKEMSLQFSQMTKVQPMYGQLGFPDTGEIAADKISHEVLSLNVTYTKVPRKKKKALKKDGTYLQWKENNCFLKGKIKLMNTPEGKIAQKTIDELVPRPLGTGSLSDKGTVAFYELISVSLVPKQGDAYEGLI